MAIYVVTDLDYLISDLRVHLGDFVEPYTYDMEYLRHALVMACKTLMKKWRNRYTINDTYVVTRSTTAVFSEASPPVVEYADERAFILQAAIIIKGGNLTDSAWDIASWRDDEISYTNLAGGKTMQDMLDRDVAELEEILKRRLLKASRQSLGGFKLPYNQAEGNE